MLKYFLLSLLLLPGTAYLFAQRGKNGTVTLSGTTNLVNAYTSLSADVAAGATVVNVSAAALPISIAPANASLSAALSAGDLILIYQAQGASIDVNTTPTTSWGGDYTISNSAMADLGNMNNYRHEWGAVTNYNNAGKYEYAEVLSVSGNAITVSCGLKNAYFVSGHTQIIRVPRFSSLTLAANALVAPTTWNGTTGGIVAIEVDGTLNFGNGSKISANGAGFRGGITDNTSGGPASSASDLGKPGYSTAGNGSEKGESISGSAAAEYTTLYYSRYGCGAPANGGGGGNYKNSGGGGGSNTGSGTYTGKGVPSSAYAAFWNLEQAGFATSPSSGGGRGGYSGAQSDQNEATVGPGNSAWQGDYRRLEGGFGGHPLAYDATRVFMGGGGGAGEMDQSQGGSGGAGGGLIFIQSYGTITGTGIVESNGANGQNSNPTGASPSASPAANQKKGVDGAGGAGAGGSILISNAAALPSTLTLSANGGNGGNNNLSFMYSFTTPNEADGPGGGGGGGFINYSSGTPATSVIGGTGGIVTTATYPSTNIVANFPPNGATGGAAGTVLNNNPFFDINAPGTTICSSSTATLTATVTGTLPSGSQVYWYPSYSSSTVLATGTTFTTPVINSTTTYYVSVCGGGTFRKPVTVTVGGPSISGTAVITNVTCTTPGSITGLTTSGGAAPVTIQWNGITTPGMNLTNASAGTYNVVVTDNAGCTATSGPYTIATSGGPTINTTNMIVTNESCTGNDGAISGITTTGNIISVSWNSGAYSTLNISNLPDGNYSLLVTDNNGCTASAGPIAINPTSGPVIDASGVTVTNETCTAANGSIAGIAVTGNGLSYQWNGVSSPSASVSALSAGNYTLVVTDNNGCTATAGPYTITNEPAQTVSTAGMTISPENCGQQNGSIFGITVSGGELPYTYSWSPGGYSTVNISALSAGNYTLTVTDNNGCVVTSGPHTIINTPNPSVNTANVAITNESCAGDDGSVTGITASGTGVVYNWGTGNSSTPDLLNASAGTYYLGVQDQYGCNSIAGPFTIAAPTPLSLNTSNATVTNTACSGNTGAINGVQVVGGINPVVSWSNGATTPDISNLAAGSYTITVSDDQGCSANATFSVGTQNSPVISTQNAVVSAEHCDQNDGSVSGVTVTGGVPAYNYVWDGVSSQNTLDISGLEAGNHTLVVTDAAGCTASAMLNVPAVSGPSVDVSGAVITDATCSQPFGSISGIVYSGSGTLTYSWTNSPQVTPGLSNVAAGSYTVTVSDAFGCTAVSPAFTIGAAALPDADFTYLPSDPVPGDAVIFTDATTGPQADFHDWTIDGAVVSDDPSFAYIFPQEGTYQVTLVVTTAEGCKDSVSKTIVILGDLVIPNVVTLGSQYNNLFLVKNLQPKSELIIFNRWGNIVFKTKDYKNDWNGRDLNGNLCDDGVYTYQLIDPEGHPYHGFLHLFNK